MAVSNAASALGQEVGKLFEDALVGGLRPLVEGCKHSIQPERLVNGTDNVYQIDAVIRDEEDNPLILLDPKYIRYTKHNRDKGSWLCTAHYNLRKTHPSIRKTIAVLAGRWTDSSVALIRSFGVEAMLLPFDRMAAVLGDYGVAFEWAEQDRATPKRALRAFRNLSEPDLRALAEDLAAPVMDDLRASVREVIETDMESTCRRISSVEVLLKTDRNEMLLLQHGTVAEAIKEMIAFMADRDDIKGLLK